MNAAKKLMKEENYELTKVLLETEASINEVAEKADVSRQFVSQKAKEMEEIGFLEIKDKSNQKILSLNEDFSDLDSWRKLFYSKEDICSVCNQTIDEKISQKKEIDAKTGIRICRGKNQVNIHYDVKIDYKN